MGVSDPRPGDAGDRIGDPAGTAGSVEVVTRWLRLLLPVVVAVTVLVASVSDPGSGASPGGVLGLPGDKLLHGLSYATLAAAFAVGLATPRRSSRSGDARRSPRSRTLRGVVLLALLGATAYGLAMEGLQFPLPYRTFDLLDAAANAVGAAAGAGLWALAASLRRRWRDRR
jgi:VanZ family protein